MVKLCRNITKKDFRFNVIVQFMHPDSIQCQHMRNPNIISALQGSGSLRGRGFGKLTDTIIKRLASYNGKAVRNITKDLDSMYCAIQASRLNSMSTDEEPKHHFCPTGFWESGRTRVW